MGLMESKAPGTQFFVACRRDVPRPQYGPTAMVPKTQPQNAPPWDPKWGGGPWAYAPAAHPQPHALFRPYTHIPPLSPPTSGGCGVRCSRALAHLPPPHVRCLGPCPHPQPLPPRTHGPHVWKPAGAPPSTAACVRTGIQITRTRNETTHNRNETTHNRNETTRSRGGLAHKWGGKRTAHPPGALYAPSLSHTHTQAPTPG